MNDSLKTVWDEIVAIVDRFTSADEIVVSVPMWNGSIPYKLKHYIDIITQPGLLFGFDPEVGYSGLLENKKAVVFYTSGVFSPGANEKYGTDFHSTYLSWWFDLIGVNDVKAVRFQPSLLTGTPEEDFNHALVRASAV
jgi:FMN-dependent NADH-azoreductase